MSVCGSVSAGKRPDHGGQKTMECYMGEIERNLDYKRWACGGFEGVHGDEGRVRGVFC